VAAPVCFGENFEHTFPMEQSSMRHHTWHRVRPPKPVLVPLTIAALAVLCGWRGHAAAPLPAEPTLYILVPDSSESIRAAIDTTVAHMSFITRPIARSRLSKINPTPQIVRVDVGSDSISVAFDEGSPVVTPLSGDTVSWRNPLTGELDEAHGMVAADTVRQIIMAQDGDRENALIFSDDGERLQLHVTVTSHRLPRPLVYDLVFHKATT
jgi:hypothetical protein